MDNLCYSTLESPVGRITVVCSDSGLRELHFAEDRVARNLRELRANQRIRGVLATAREANGGRTPADRFARQAAHELKEYFGGRRKTFAVPLDVAGTPFQKKVWRALSEIPYGEVRSYGQIARRVGNARASRAVGSANGSNPVAIVVPCHRVISSDGTLGGYGGGLRNKSYLLQLEQSTRQHTP